MTSEYAEPEEREDEDTASIEPLEVVRFVLVAARRHWWLGALATLSVIGLGVAAAILLPKKYETLTRVLVGQDGFMVQVNPDRRGLKVDEFRGLRDRVLRQDNLRAIVQETDLITLWTRHRPPLLRFKDRLLSNGLDQFDEKTQVRALMGTLEQRLDVETDNSTHITFRATWTDPETATRIVQAARKRFFEDRLRSETDVYQEVVVILEEQAKNAAREVERLLKQVEKASWYEPPPAAESSPQRVVQVAPAPEVKPEPDPLLVVKLEKVRQRIRDTQEPWQRRLMELKLQLTDLRATYAPKHPLVIHQETRIQEASIPPPELEALKAEESQLLAQIEAYSAPQQDAPKRTVRVSEPSSSAPAQPQPVRIENSATLSAEQSKLIQAINRYNELSSRIASTRLEITTAETAFKHRYLIAAEAEVPDKPLKPKLPLFITLGSILFGLVLGLAIGPALELLRGRILAPWQVKRLGLPVLGELPLHSPER